MSNIIVGISDKLTREEIRVLGAKKVSLGYFGFDYTRYSKPSQDIINKCVLLQDIDAFEVKKNSLIEMYVNRHMVKITI